MAGLTAGVTRSVGVAAVFLLAVVHGVAATPLNIVALGASNTAGWGVGPQNAYPAKLEALLRARGFDAHVANAGISFSTTNGMLHRLDEVVPVGTSIVILQPSDNDVRFFGSKEQRIRNIEAIVARMRVRHIRTIVFENAVVPAGDYQWDGIHFTAKGHDMLAEYLLKKIVGAPPGEQPAGEESTAEHKDVSQPEPAVGRSAAQ